jgi:hypothetical protein
VREVVRSGVLWATVVSITLAVVLLITVAPAREITHTVLGWLRVTPLELDDDVSQADATATTEPAAPAPTLADVVEIVSVDPSTSIPDATPEDIGDLPFAVIEIDPPAAFSSDFSRSVTRFGTLTLGLDTADLAAVLAPGFPSRRLARRLGTDEITVAGGALVVTTWPADGKEGGEIALYQIEAPLVTGLPPRDLELLAELISQAFVPPIISREMDVLDIPLVRLALGLEVESEAGPTEASVTELPNGEPAVTWARDRSQLVLTGPVAPEALLLLASTARAGS